jgi:hypothetical protein
MTKKIEQIIPISASQNCRNFADPKGGLLSIDWESYTIISFKMKIISRTGTSKLHRTSTRGPWKAYVSHAKDGIITKNSELRGCSVFSVPKIKE